MRENVKVGIDLSLRSTGICVIDKDNKLIDCLLHKTKKTDDEITEQLLIDNVKTFRNYILKVKEKYFIDEIIIEGLSLNSKSSMRDVIDAHHWYLRIMIHELNLPFRVVSPREWRKTCSIQPKGIKQKDLKAKYGKDFWKLLAVERLDEKTKDFMNSYIKLNKWNKLKYDKHIWDLTDAFWIAQS